MHRVLARIDEHLDKQLDLGTLAEVAHFSPFHFHRIFSAWMGETLGDCLVALLPGGKYAVLNFRGTVEQVAGAWAALLRDWLPSSGLQLDGRACFEYYPKGSSYDSATGKFECEICIPVVLL